MKPRILVALGISSIAILVLYLSTKQDSTRPRESERHISARETPLNPTPQTPGTHHRSHLSESPTTDPSNRPAATPGQVVIDPPNKLHVDLGADPEMEARRKDFIRRMMDENTAREKRVADYLASLSEESRKLLPADLELHDVVEGHPRFIGPENAEASISSNATLLRSPLFGGLTGAGVSIGVWESGLFADPRFNDEFQSGHDDWTSRFSHGGDFNPVAGSSHSWNVIGILIGSGTGDPLATGMAPGASAVLLGSSNMLTELASIAASSMADATAGKLVLSNHSYGFSAGWGRSSNGSWNWSGTPFAVEDELFGTYGQEAADLDELTQINPFHLPFISAGNDRDDGPPPLFTSYRRPSNPLIYRDPDTGELISNSDLSVLTYDDPSNHPPADAAAHGGYDTINGGFKTAKNGMTVGSVTDAIFEHPGAGKIRSPQLASSSPFSSWGPVDDGRIKPDLVAVGSNIYTTDAQTVWVDLADGWQTLALSTTGYTTNSGTSFSSPTACGTAALLLEHYRNLFPSQTPPAALLKGLILHTADDIGNPGPDGQFGWGLMNGAAAAEVMSDHAAAPSENILFTSALPSGGTHTSTHFWDEEGPIRITLCYADQPGTPKIGLNNREPALVNDLDILLTGPNGQTIHPYRLDPENPTATATTGDNDVDNVKQIFIADPLPGPYTLTVTTDGPLSGVTFQSYTLVRTGLSNQAPAIVPQLVTPTQSYEQDFANTKPLSHDGWTYRSTGAGRATFISGGVNLDSSGGASLSSTTLHADLSAFTPASTLSLEIQWRDFADESHTLPASHDGLGNGDGISVSADGITWHRISDLHSSSPSSVLQTLTLNLESLIPSLGISYNSNFRIRFSQYGEQSFPNDGIRIESVRLYQRSAGLFKMGYAQLEEDESSGSVTVRVDRIEGTQGPASVSYSTRNLTAIAGTDYVQKTGTLNFVDGQTSASFNVDFIGNPAAHGPRVFEVILSAPGGAALYRTKKTVVIISDDIESSTLRTDPATLRPTLVHGSSSHRQTLRAWNLNGYGRRQMEVTSNTPWITVGQLRQGDAITPALITLNYDLSQLPKGRHLGSVTVHQITAPASSREVPVVLTLGYPGEAITATTSNAPADLPVDGPVPLQGPASRYPLTLPAAASPYRVGAVFLGFDGLTHTNPADLDIVLASPDGKSSLIVSDAASSETGSPITFGSLLGDPFLQSIPHVASAGADGPRRPINYEGFDPDLMPAPAPQTPGRLLADLAGGSTAGTWKIFINDDAEANGGSVASAWLEIQTVDLSDGLYENPGDFDLGGQSILFTPEDSALGYLAGRSSVGGLPSITPGPIVSPNKDGYTTVSLTGGKSVPFYGITYTTLGIGENGDIVFGTPPATSGKLTTDNFLSLPRLAALFGNLSYQASGSSIHYQQLDDRIRVVWAKLIDDKTGSQVSFSAEVFFDGRIRLTWDPTDDTTAFVGLSRGYGSEEFALPSDFSTLTEPPLEIRSYQFTPGGECTIAWSSIPDLTYILEWSPNLLNWNPITSTPGDPGEATFKTFTDPGDGTRLFLRVRKPNDL